jgi:hypothetical protein
VLGGDLDDQTIGQAMVASGAAAVVDERRR